MKQNIQALKQILIVALLVLLIAPFSGGRPPAGQAGPTSPLSLDERVMPSAGIVLPIDWASLGQRMAEAGVIDAENFSRLYGNGGLPPDMRAVAFESHDGVVRMDRENAGVFLNLLWAFGLSNKNPVLEKGPMVDRRYGGDASRFAALGGWTLAVGNVMDHYSMHPFVVLDAEQQERVERVSKNIYRPCCGNPVYFPDCNHGMAMLGLLELLAAEGASEDEMYRVALAVNSYWFSDTYMTLATYFEQHGTDWDSANPRVVLGADYSSAEGYRRVLKEIEPAQLQNGASCGVS